MYPDNCSSICFEPLRKVIQDAEKIRILREEFTANNMLDKLDYLNDVVAQFQFTKEP